MTENTMLTYLQMRGDLSFRQVPFQELDAMILTQLSYLSFENLIPTYSNVNELCKKSFFKLPTLKEVSHSFTASDHPADVPSDPRLQVLSLAGQSKRFGDIRMDGYINDIDYIEQKQFSAITFRLNPFHSFIAFRGTDGELNSWRENFNMLYLFPIPAQRDSCKYFEVMAKGFLQKSDLAGHSKGGNLALYAALFSQDSAAACLNHIYTFDAPGFLEDYSSHARCQKLKGRIHAFLPQASIIGRLMCSPVTPTIIESSGTGVNQHSMFTWHTTNNAFCKMDSFDSFSEDMSGQIKAWLDRLPFESRQQNIEDFFTLLDSQGIKTFDDFTHMDFRKLLGLSWKATSLSKENKELLILIFRNLFPDPFHR